MQVTVEDAGTLRKQITVAYPADEVRAREERLLGRYAQQTNLPGFRRGKVPRGLLRKRYGEAVAAEAAEALIDEAMQEAIREHQLRPIGPIAQDDFSREDGLRHVASFDIRPPVQLPQQDDLTIDFEDAAASDAEIDAELANYAKRAGEQVELDGEQTLVKDDLVKLTGKLTSGDEVIREVHDLTHIVGAYPLFGKDPEAVAELAAAVNVGGVLSFDTTLPDNFKPEEWADKEAQVAVTVQSATRQQPAELDDALAKRAGAEDLADLRQRIGDYLSNQKSERLHQRQTEQLMEELLDQAQLELPPKLFETVTQDVLSGKIEEKKKEDAEQDEAALRDELADEAAKEADHHLRRMLVLDALAEDLQVEATQEDLQQQIMMAAYQSGRKPQELAEQLRESGQLQQVLVDIRQHKSIATLLQQIVDARQPASSDDAGDDEAAADSAAEEAPAKKKPVMKKKKTDDEATETATADED